MARLIALSRDNVENILNGYDIGSYVSHKHIPVSLANTVYLLETTEGKFILKVHQESKRREVEFIFQVTEYARQRGIPAAEIMKNKHSRFITIQNNHAISIQRFVEGKVIEMDDKEKIILAARTAGMLDVELIKIPLKGRFRITSNRLPHIIRNAPVIKGIDIPKEFRRVFNESEIKEERLRRSIIHADLGGHMLYKDKKITAIIDWDDTREYYLVYEAAHFIIDQFLISKKTLKGKVALFLKEYQKFIKLSKEEKHALYYLIKYGYLDSIWWYSKQLKTRKHGEVAKWIKELIEKYRSFDTITLEEFLKEID